MLQAVLRGQWRGTTFYTLGWPTILAVAQGLPDATCPIPEFYTQPRQTSVFAPDQQHAHDILTTPGFLDWSQPIAFLHVSKDMGDVIESLSKAHCGKGDVLLRENCYVMEVKKGEMTSSKIPPVVAETREIRSEAEIDWVIQHWVYGMNHSESYVSELVKSFPSLIALDNTGRYLGCEIGYEYGTIGMLHVVPEARGQGLGSYVTGQLAEKYFDQGLQVMVNVHADNSASLRLHEKLGFRKMAALELIFHKANRMPGRITTKC